MIEYILSYLISNLNFLDEHEHEHGKKKKTVKRSQRIHDNMNECLVFWPLVFLLQQWFPLFQPLAIENLMEISIYFLLLLKNFQTIWFLSGAWRRDCRGATSLNPISDLVHWAHLVLFFSLPHHTCYSLLPHHSPPPSKPLSFLLHWTLYSLTSLPSPLSFLFSLRTNESILPRGWDHGG